MGFSIWLLASSGCHAAHEQDDVVSSAPRSPCAEEYITATSAGASAGNAAKEARSTARRELLQCLDVQSSRVAAQVPDEILTYADEPTFAADLLHFARTHEAQIGLQRVYGLYAAIYVIADAQPDTAADIRDDAHRLSRAIAHPTGGERFERGLSETVALVSSPKFLAAFVVGGQVGRAAGWMVRGRRAGRSMVWLMDFVGTQSSRKLILQVATDDRTPLPPNLATYPGGAYLAAPTQQPIFQAFAFSQSASPSLPNFGISQVMMPSPSYLPGTSIGVGSQYGTRFTRGARVEVDHEAFRAILARSLDQQPTPDLQHLAAAKTKASDG